uniref:Uncharacterized protein n=1 Tax=Arundo donax TaxID=35708 RepID=A0A0A9BHJ3_ARUDO
MQLLGFSRKFDAIIFLGPSVSVTWTLF